MFSKKTNWFKTPKNKKEPDNRKPDTNKKDETRDLLRKDFGHGSF